MRVIPTESLGYIVLAVVALTVCYLLAREIVIASVPELRRRNRRRVL